MCKPNWGCWEPLPLCGCHSGVMRKGYWSCFLLLKRVGFLKMDGGSASKPKGRRKFKNLECSINFDARGSGSSRGKGRIILRV
jgi:hypothetical protein